MGFRINMECIFEIQSTNLICNLRKLFLVRGNIAAYTSSVFVLLLISRAEPLNFILNLITFVIFTLVISLNKSVVTIIVITDLFTINIIIANYLHLTCSFFFFIYRLSRMCAYQVYKSQCIERLLRNSEKSGRCLTTLWVQKLSYRWLSVFRWLYAKTVARVNSDPSSKLNLRPKSVNVLCLL